MKQLFLTISFFFLSFFSWGFETDLISERPGQALTPQCLKRGWVQVQSGYEYAVNNYTGPILNLSDVNTKTVAYLSNTVVRFGLGRKFEINSTFNIDPMSTIFQTPMVGFKLKLFENFNHMLSVQYNSTVSQIKEELFSNGLLLISTHNLGNDFNFSFTGGYTYFPSEDDANTNYVLSFGYSPTKRLNFVAEHFAVYNNEFKAYFDAGVGVLITPVFQLDTFFGGGVNHHEQYYFINSGITYRFGS